MSTRNIESIEPDYGKIVFDAAYKDYFPFMKWDNQDQNVRQCHKMMAQAVITAYSAQHRVEVTAEEMFFWENPTADEAYWQHSISESAKVSWKKRAETFNAYLRAKTASRSTPPQDSHGLHATGGERGTEEFDVVRVLLAALEGPESCCYRHETIMKIVGHLQSKVLIFTDRDISTEDWIKELTGIANEMESAVNMARRPKLASTPENQGVQLPKTDAGSQEWEYRSGKEIADTLLRWNNGHTIDLPKGLGHMPFACMHTLAEWIRRPRQPAAAPVGKGEDITLSSVAYQTLVNQRDEAREQVKSLTQQRDEAVKEAEQWKEMKEMESFTASVALNQRDDAVRALTEKDAEIVRVKEQNERLLAGYVTIHQLTGETDLRPEVEKVRCLVEELTAFKSAPKGRLTNADLVKILGPETAKGLMVDMIVKEINTLLSAPASPWRSVASDPPQQGKQVLITNAKGACVSTGSLQANGQWQAVCPYPLMIELWAEIPPLPTPAVEQDDGFEKWRKSQSEALSTLWPSGVPFDGSGLAQIQNAVNKLVESAWQTALASRKEGQSHE